MQDLQNMRPRIVRSKLVYYTVQEDPDSSDASVQQIDLSGKAIGRFETVNLDQWLHGFEDLPRQAVEDVKAHTPAIAAQPAATTGAAGTGGRRKASGTTATAPRATAKRTATAAGAQKRVRLTPDLLDRIESREITRAQAIEIHLNRKQNGASTPQLATANS